MMEWSIFWWPFGVTFTPRGLIVLIIILTALIWMLIDCTRRIFRDNNEKIFWIIIITLGSWIGSLVYFVLVKKYNPKGLIEQKTRKK